MKKEVYFPNFQGDQLCGVIENPSSDKNKLIVVLAHGLRSSKDSDTYTVLADRLAEHDISSLRFDFTGHGKSQGDFPRITFTQAIDDINQALDYLKTNGYSQIGLMGSSFGGLASLIVTSQNNDLKLLALKSPVSHYPRKLKEVEGDKVLAQWKKQGHRFYQDKQGNKFKLNYSFYQDSQKYDVHQIASQIKIPTLIVHGDADQTVPYQQSLKTCRLIPDCKLTTIKNGDHQYSNPQLKERMWQAMVDFILENTPKS